MKTVCRKFLYFADDQGHTSASNSSFGIGESPGTLQRLLQQVYHLSERENAKRKFTSQRLQSPGSRHGPFEWQQRKQSSTGSSHSHSQGSPP